MVDKRTLVQGPNLDVAAYYEALAASRDSDAEDIGKLLYSTSGSATAYTVLRDSSMAAPVGARITLIQGGAGALTVAAGTGVTINKLSGASAGPVGRYAEIRLHKTAADTWVLTGDLGTA